jgi:hypothetical protein
MSSSVFKVEIYGHRILVGDEPGIQDLNGHESPGWIFFLRRIFVWGETDKAMHFFNNQTVVTAQSLTVIHAASFALNCFRTS